MKVNKLKILIAALFVIGHLTFVITAAQAVDGGTIADPMTIGVGARPLGMGRAYVAVAENGDAIFVNPAGLARITSPNLTSMYSSLLNDVSYIVIGGAYPLANKSAIGAGLINSRVGDIILKNASGETLATDASWGNTVLFLSYGTYLSEIPGLNTIQLGKDVLLGSSLKYYSVGGAGSSAISNAAGSAFALDLSVLYPLNEYTMLGANAQNFIASKVSKSSGVAESLPRQLKVGGRVCLIGDEDKALSPHSARKLYISADYDYIPGAQPNPLHLGLEFWPNSNLALRAGSDDSELTAGIGVRFSGVEFNYAYHPFNGISENTTHFFSLGYVGEAIKRSLRVQIDSPSDKAVIHDDHVTVSGKVIVDQGDESQGPAGLISVKVNGISLPVNADNTFSADVPVEKIGKKLIQVEAMDSAGDYANKDFRILRLVNFADVPDGYWAKDPIENTGTVGLVQGFPDGTFKPDRALTRAELATLLVRAKGLELPDRKAQKIFSDVKSDFWAAKYIEVARNAGLVTGYPDGTFRPNNQISKVEGIAVLARFDNLRLAQVVEKPYWDLTTRHWAAKYVQAAKEAGMLTYVESNTLKPSSQLNRSQAVEMLSKTKLAGGQIKDLYTWEKGFKQEVTPQRPQIRAGL